VFSFNQTEVHGHRRCSTKHGQSQHGARRRDRRSGPLVEGGPGLLGLDWRRELRELVIRVSEAPGIVLFDAVEAGVPLHVVNMIAGATGEPVSAIMDLIGVPPTTFHRRGSTNEPLPDVAGHRVMGYLRVVASLRRLLEESGDPAQLKDFDLEAWVAHWMREGLPELGGKTPAEMLRNPEGQRAVEQVLERMRGGLVA
jgi:putative toxin-antitoxin system antitoxin component (TIGR02293 family)